MIRQETGTWYVQQRKYRQLRHHLRKSKHHSPALSNAWEKYGELNFEFVIVEECQTGVLHDRENYGSRNLVDNTIVPQSLVQLLV